MASIAPVGVSVPPLPAVTALSVAVAVAVGTPLEDDSVKKDEVAHWSGVHMGEMFTVTVPHEVRSLHGIVKGEMTLRLQRNPATGYSESLEPSWSCAPDKARADSLQMLKQSVHGTQGKALRDEKFPREGLKPKRQVKLRFGVAQRPAESPAVSSPARERGSEELGGASQGRAEPTTPAMATPNLSEAGSRSLPSSTRTAAIDREDTLQWARHVGEMLTEGVAMEGNAHVTGQLPTFCNGIYLNDLCDSLGVDHFQEPFHVHYPFVFHTSTTAWKMPKLDGRVYSVECEKRDHIFAQPDASCAPCKNLKHNNLLHRLLERQADAQLPTTHANDIYLSHAQMGERRKLQLQRASVGRIEMWNQRRRIRDCPTPTPPHPLPSPSLVWFGGSRLSRAQVGGGGE